jgi:hypothetical protein
MQFAIFDRGDGPTLLNMASGLRLLPVTKNGLSAGLRVIFPDGHTEITVRGDFETIAQKLNAVDLR